MYLSIIWLNIHAMMTTSEPIYLLDTLVSYTYTCHILQQHIFFYIFLYLQKQCRKLNCMLKHNTSTSTRNSYTGRNSENLCSDDKCCTYTPSSHEVYVDTQN